MQSIYIYLYKSYTKSKIMSPRVTMDGGDNSDILMVPKIYKPSSLYSMLTTLEVTLDYLSKWIAAAVVGALMLWARDGRGLWAGIGALANWGLSMGLKILIDQPRPFPAKKTDPGMPSSHSQTLFYGFTFLALSISEFLGMSHLAFTLGGLAIYFSSYLSWLRVTQRYHTRNQVVVGALLGTLFCVAWLRTWTLIVSHSFHSFLWVRILVVLGAAAFWMVLLSITNSTFRRARKAC